MRSFAWIAPIALGLGLLGADLVREPDPIPAETGLENGAAPPGDTGAAAGRTPTGSQPTPSAGSAQTAASADAATAGSSRTGPVASATGSRPALDEASPRSLDDASPREIRLALEQAIAAEQRERPLFVAPGIVDQVAERGRVRVIFRADGALDADATGQLLSGTGRSASFDGLRLFPLLGHGAAEVGPEALRQLIQHPESDHIELDGVHRASLEETRVVIGADLAHQAGHDGDGLAVAVLDTGVDPDHPMLTGRIVEEACFSVEGDCPNGQTQMFGPGAAIPCGLPGCGHGTLVSGIAVSRDPLATLDGVAPGASLIAIQIFSDVDGEPGAYASDILAGLQHVLALTAFHSIASVNLSLGGDLFTSEQTCDQMVASQYTAVDLLRAADVVTVAASGNEYLTNALTTPACLSNVVGVGSTSDADVVSDFSNSAEFLSLLAPGEAVETTANGGGSGLASGTSMASPHVAGAVAAIREALPDASAGEIENALSLSGVPVLDLRNGLVTPRLDVVEAIALLESAAVTPDPPIDPATSGNGGGGGAASPSGGGGGGGGCGLVGLEPLLVLGLVRFGRRRLGSQSGRA